MEPVQEGSDARRKEVLRAERTESYVSTQGRLTTPQMALHGQAPRYWPIDQPMPCCVKNALSIDRELVVISRPTAIRKIPLTTVTAGMSGPMNRIRVRNVFSPSAVTSRGNPSPSEYAASNWMPCPTECVVLAYRRIDPRIGPTHGVHPPAQPLVRQQELADHGRRGAEQDEHGRKPRDEQQGVLEGPPLDPQALLAARQLLQRQAGDVRDVRRHQRQHARRDEREESGGKRDGERGRGAVHAPLLRAPRRGR